MRAHTQGPTVYDVCHMGHARAYLTFDILRRIMTDYLHYDVQYHVNITDVDDKIILRARKNKLLGDYLASNPQPSDVHARCQGALMAAEASASKKLADIEAQLAQPSTDALRPAELQEQLEQTKLKRDKLAEKRSAFAQLHVDQADFVVTAAKLMSDELSTALDAELGATVTDNGIFDAHARVYEKSFMDDMARLGVRPPDVLTRVTEYVPAIVRYVQTLVDKRLAYVSSSGSVYLDIAEFKRQGHDYRKLKPRVGATTDVELAESEGALGAAGEKEKKDPSDFALWKASKPGEPRWESPWGLGRPGWHIECSVVASDVLGQTLDIHAGGEDLKFPHHDNELAQSEAHFGCQQWVNYFFHAGHLQIKGLKMSKSLKNFVTIAEALEKDPPRLLRILFLIQPWDGSFTYSPDQLDEARSIDKRFASFFDLVKELERQPWLDRALGQPTAGEREFARKLAETKTKVHAALCDNFDTPEAIKALLGLVDAFYKYNDAQRAVLVCVAAGRYVTSMLGVFGLSGADAIGLHEQRGESKEAVVGPVLDALLEFREQVRASISGSSADVAALRAASDHLRDEALVRCGVRVADRPGQAALWSLQDARELVAEQQALRAKQEAERVNKARRKQEAALKAAQQYDDALRNFRALDARFRTAEYSAWDPDGLPTKDAAGAEVSPSHRKKLAKEQESVRAAYAKLEEAARKESMDPEAFCAKKRVEAAAANGAGEAAVKGSFTVAGNAYPTNVTALVGKSFASAEEFTRAVAKAP